MPFQSSGGRLPASAETDDSVNASIRRIIHTRKGERPMRPNVGSRVWDYVFENVNATAKALIRADARRSVQAQEPRITVLSVKVSSFDELIGFPGRTGYLIDFTYRLSGKTYMTSTELDPEASA